ncbi:MAG: Hpt domain-containing protein [Rickettsiales bacterium]|nr:Hpt domain-containing protein [Rickettsiales bacterium]
MENNLSDNASKKAIDVDFLRSIIENDAEFEKELFAIFIENANRNIEKMEDAIKVSNDNSWYMASHAFKGAAASVGAFDLSKILEYAQKHPEENYEQKTELLKKIKEELSSVINFINEELLKK